MKKYLKNVWSHVKKKKNNNPKTHSQVHLWMAQKKLIYGFMVLVFLVKKVLAISKYPLQPHRLTQ